MKHRTRNKAARRRTHPMAGQSLSAAVNSNVCCLQQPTYVITHRTTSFVKRACSAYGLSFSVLPKNPPGAVTRGHIARPLVDFTGRSAGARTDIRRTQFRDVYRSVLPASTLYGVGYPGVKNKLFLIPGPILCGCVNGYLANAHGGRVICSGATAFVKGRSRFCKFRLTPPAHRPCVPWPRSDWLNLL